MEGWSHFFPGASPISARNPTTRTRVSLITTANVRHLFFLMSTVSKRTTKLLLQEHIGLSV